ncbi:putative DNA endonuclease VII [Streptomyces phage Dagobah]|nr:putative DNA endonuclease VII [Streptomyces phage Dagobah]
MNTTARVRHCIDNAPAGGTVALDGVLSLPTHGYFVGGAGPLLVFQSEDMLRESWGIVESFVSSMTVHGHRYIGWWTDPETEKVYLDCTTWHPDMYQADRHAMRRGEIAFYDVEGRTDIKTGSTGVGEPTAA